MWLKTIGQSTLDAVILPLDKVILANTKRSDSKQEELTRFAEIWQRDGKFMAFDGKLLNSTKKKVKNWVILHIF